MGITHLKDGEGFFDGGYAEAHRDFGFSGSAPATPRQSYAKGGSVAKAKPPMRTSGIEQMHDESEFAHRVRKASGGSINDDDDDGMYGLMVRDPVTGKLRGSTVSREKQPAKNADDGLRKANGGGVQVPAAAPFPQEPTSMPRQLEALGDGGVKMARGGRAKLPRGMKATALQAHSPINTPPRNPTRTTTPRNIMPGGAMAYGVQPSSEPNQAGSEQGIPQLKDGGKVRMGALRGTY